MNIRQNFQSRIPERIEDIAELVSVCNDIVSGDKIRLNVNVFVLNLLTFQFRKKISETPTRGRDLY